MSGMQFRKSSRSQSGGDNGCVGLAVKPEQVFILDTKKPDAGMFSVPRKSFAAFLKTV